MVHQAYYQTPGHVVAAGVVLSLVDITAVSLRVLARKKQKQAFRWDDWFIIPAMLFTVGIGIILVYGVSQHALGYPLEVPVDYSGNPLEISTAQTTETSKAEISFLIMLPIALGCAKLSILFFYFRIFAATTASKRYWFLVGLQVFVGMWTVAFFLSFVFQCRLHFWAFFGSTMDLIQNCPGTMYIDLSFCITDFATDLVILAIPVPLIWNITHLSVSNKVTALAIFLLGSTTVIASLLRSIVLIKIVIGGFDPELDEILVITESLYWGMVECGVAICAACFPVSQVLFRDLPWNKVFSRPKSTSDNSDISVSQPSSDEGKHSITVRHTVRVSHRDAAGSPV
ncbi:plasma membrane protein Pth11-like protein [Cladorrhinum sp. PSN259]|nr:plasma membrane protein Pth11-like protein [Cladorrhinum sp. PSN259]